MDNNILFRKILGRTKIFTEQLYSSFRINNSHKMSRLKAKILRKNHVQKNSHSVVDSKLKKRIKEYCNSQFGSTGYWPWIAFYTELRGEFIEGWIPYDYFRFILLPKWNPKPRLSANKTFDHRLFPGFSIEPIFIKIAGNFYDASMTSVTLDKVISDLKSFNQEVVLKLDKGSGGKNVSFYLSGKIDKEKLNTSTNLVIQPVIKQHKNLQSLYPHAVNTLRVATFQNHKEISVLFTILRFGVNGSRIDNLSAGGGFLIFNGKTNLLPNAFDENGFKIGDKHPDTGFIFKDLKIPAFAKALDLCKRAHSKYPYQKLVNWDVCIDVNGNPKLIEWNTGNASLYVIEAVIGPLWYK